ncbi:MAG: hypothetical protein ACKOXZ_12770, partial [Polynucleobacter victoriensis]
LIQQALDFGANGFLSKSSEPDELINAISYVMNDEVVISKDLQGLLGANDGTPHEQLSAREFGILLKLAEGVRINEAFGDVISWDMLPESAISTMTVVPGSNPMYGMNTLSGALVMTTKSGLTHEGNEIE